MPNIHYSNLHSLTIPTIRKITTREIRKLQFELMYPDLIRALKYTKQKVEEKSYNFIHDLLLVNNFGTVPTDDQIIETVSRSDIGNMFFDFFQTSNLNQPADFFDNLIDKEEIIIFLNKLRPLLKIPYEIAKKNDIDFELLISKFSLRELTTEFNLTSFIRDVFDIQYAIDGIHFLEKRGSKNKPKHFYENYNNYLPEAFNHEDEAEQKIKLIHEISKLKHDLLRKYELPNLTSTSAHFSNVHKVNLTIQKKSYQNDYLSLNLHFTETPSNISNILIEYLTEYLLKRESFDNQFNTPYQKKTDDELKAYANIQNIIETLESIENTNNSKNNRLDVLLNRLICLNFLKEMFRKPNFKFKDIYKSHDYDKHMKNLAKILEKKAEYPILEKTVRELFFPQIVPFISPFKSKLNYTTPTDKKTIENLVCKYMDYEVKKIQKKTQQQNIINFRNDYLDLNKLKEQLAIAKLNELQDPYLH